jgi:hypothetical protein
LPLPFADELQSAGLEGLRNWIVGELEKPLPNPDDHIFHQIAWPLGQCLDASAPFVLEMG